VWAAGGFALEFPTIRLGEIYTKLTTVLTKRPALLEQPRPGGPVPLGL